MTMTMKLPVGFPCGLPTRRNMSWIRESTCLATLTLHLPPVVGPQPFVQQYQKKNCQSQEEILRNEFLYFLCDTFSCALSCLRIPGGPLAAYKPTSRWHCWPYRDPLYNVWKHVKIHKSHNDFEKFHSFHEIIGAYPCLVPSTFKLWRQLPISKYQDWATAYLLWFCKQVSPPTYQDKN